MANKTCVNCGEFLEHGDLIAATFITRFIKIASKVNYALERPTECYELHHVNCQFPQGDKD